MSEMLFFTGLALSFRWFVFQFKHTSLLRSLLKFIWGEKLGEELMHCPYCQSIEAGLVVAAALYLLGERIHYELLPLYLLFAGLVGLISSPLIDFLIELQEGE